MRRLPAAYVREHLELAYATTVYGAQGETAASAHLLMGEHTGAAAAYVAMTRGRSHNVAHLIAGNVDEARDQWMATFGRGRADLGPTHAARLAAEAVDRYGTHRPLDRVLADLRRAWSTEGDLSGRLRGAERWRDRLAAVVPLRAEVDRDLAHHQRAVERCREGAEHSRARIDRIDGAVTLDADRVTRALQQTWQVGFPGAFRAAQTVRAGAGPLGLHRAKVRRASGDLEAWAQTWRPVLPGLPADPDTLAVLLTEQRPHLGTPRLREAFALHARETAERDHPDFQEALDDAAATTHQAAVVEAAYTAAAQSRARRLRDHGSSAYIKDPAHRLTDAEQLTGDLTVQLNTARARVDALRLEPAIRALPPGRLSTERDLWQQDSLRQEAANQRAALNAVTDPPSPGTSAHHERMQPPSLGPRQPDRGFSR